MKTTPKSKALRKEKEPYFGLPHGEKDTPQLRKRFKNYVKKEAKQEVRGLQVRFPLQEVKRYLLHEGNEEKCPLMMQIKKP